MTDQETASLVGFFAGFTLVTGGALVVFLDKRRRYWRQKFLDQQGEHMLHDLHHHPETVK